MIGQESRFWSSPVAAWLTLFVLVLAGLCALATLGIVFWIGVIR